MKILEMKMKAAVEAGIFNQYQAFAIMRCVQFNDQIADISIGNVWREELKPLMVDHVPYKKEA